MAKNPKILNKIEIAETLSGEYGLTKMMSEGIVENILISIKKGVESGRDVSLGSFGIFRKKLRKGRRGRNPRTGVECDVPDRFIVKFVPAIAFKELIK